VNGCEWLFSGAGGDELVLRGLVRRAQGASETVLSPGTLEPWRLGTTSQSHTAGSPPRRYAASLCETFTPTLPPAPWPPSASARCARCPARPT
jgi:hypothetical protein